MQRDMELIRAILLQLAEHDHGFAPPEFELAGYSEEQIGFHVHLMGQAGLLQTVDATTHSDPSPRAMPLAITWQGYEFLDAARSDSLWKKAGSQIAKAGVSVSFEILKQVLMGLAKEQLKLHG